MRTKDEMTLPECARTLGVSWAQAYRLVLTGELESRQVGARYFVSATDVKRLRRERSAEEPAAATA
jgi:phage FluMu gp28-like protein